MIMKKQVALGIDIGGTNTTFGFIDREGNYIMITAPNRRVNEKIYITVTCNSCGAKNQVIKGRLSNCEYCGQRLNS